MSNAGRRLCPAANLRKIIETFKERQRGSEPKSGPGRSPSQGESQGQEQEGGCSGRLLKRTVPPFAPGTPQKTLFLV